MPVLHAPPPPSPQEIDREIERRERLAKEKAPKRGTEQVDFYL
jgi:hypothetical protein